MLTVLVCGFITHFISLPQKCSFGLIIIQWLLKLGTTSSINSQNRKNPKREFCFRFQGIPSLLLPDWPFPWWNAPSRDSKMHNLEWMWVGWSNFRKRRADLSMPSWHSSWLMKSGLLRISWDACTSTLEKWTNRKRSATSSTQANSNKCENSIKSTDNPILI